MADDDDLFGSDDTGDTSQNQSGSGLRKQLEDALKELKTAKEQNADLESKVRQSTIDKTFSELEIPEKIRKFYGGEADRAKILEWVQENADIFGITAPGEDATEPQETKARNDSMRNVQAAGSVGSDAGNTSLDAVRQSAMTKIKQGASEADVNAELAKLFPGR